MQVVSSIRISRMLEFGVGVRKNVGKMLKCGYGFYKKIPDEQRRDRRAGLLEEKRGSRKNSAYWVCKFGARARKIAEKGAKTDR